MFKFGRIAYKNGKVTPINVAEKIIENIYEINPKLNIICDFDEELIRQQASASSQRYREGCPIGPLDGVPCVVKDQVKVKGLRMRDGLPFKNQASIDDAEIIRRLKDWFKTKEIVDQFINKVSTRLITLRRWHRFGRLVHFFRAIYISN